MRMPESRGHIALCLLLCTGAFAVDVPRTQPAAAAANGQPVPTKAFNPGDAIKISAYPDTASFVNSIYFIDGNGDVDLPIIGKKRIVDMTEKELQSDLDSAYLKYLRYPGIQVQPLMRMSLLGGFTRPGLYYVNPGQPFWNAVAQAGGTVREDGIAKLVWERGHQTISRDLIDAFESGASMASFGFHSGDRIRVTARPRTAGWEIFRNDVLPVLSFVLTSATTVATLYISYETYKINRR